MVDVDHFHGFLVFQRVGHWPTVDGSFAEVNRALVVCMVQTSHADQRNEPRRIDIVCDLLFHNADIVAMFLVQQREATASWRAFSNA